MRTSTENTMLREIGIGMIQIRNDFVFDIVHSKYFHVVAVTAAVTFSVCQRVKCESCKRKKMPLITKIFAFSQQKTLISY